MNKLYFIPIVGLLVSNFTLAKGNDFVGSYISETEGGIERLAILDDKTFCYGYFGGRYDVITAGRWRDGKNSGTIELKEVNTNASPYIVKGSKGPDAGIKFGFHGSTLAYAGETFFAVSNTEAPPKTLKILFEPRTTWAANYFLPEFPKKSVRYFFIGKYSKNKATGKPSVEWQRYRIDSNNQFAIAFNEQVNMNAFEATAKINGKNLSIADKNSGKGFRSFGQKNKFEDEELEEVKKTCIDPVIHNQVSSKSVTMKPDATLSVPLDESVKPNSFWFKNKE